MLYIVSDIFYENMPKSKRASTTSNLKASGHPLSEERSIPKAQDTVPLLLPHLNADSETPSREFVHHGALLVRDPTKTQASTLSLDTQGQLVALPKSVAKISTIDNWTDAFLIFFKHLPKGTS